MNKLFNVHEIIKDLVIDKAELGNRDAKTTVRIPSKLKEKTQSILNSQGLSVSEFVNGCCARLVKEYSEPVELS